MHGRANFPTSKIPSASIDKERIYMEFQCVIKILKVEHAGAGNRTRTDTPFSRRQDLNLVRLPISPSPHERLDST